MKRIVLIAGSVFAVHGAFAADAARLERALGGLPAMTRSVLWLYHVEEYTHQEIAEMTGKSVSFSKSQVARGGIRLRRLLDNAEVAPCLAATV